MPTIIRRDHPNIIDFGPRLGGAQDLIPNGDLQAAIQQAPKRPHLIGFNSLDMLAFGIPNPFIPPTLKGLIPIPKLSSLLLFNKAYFSKIINRIFGDSDIFGNNATLISEEIISHYSSVAAKYPLSGWVQAYLQCLSDVDFYVPAIREARDKAAAGWSNIYMYRYSYANPLIQVVLDPRIQGSPHAFELLNFFDVVLAVPEPPPTFVDLKVRKNFVDLFIGFVKGTGMPVAPVNGAGGVAPYVDVNVENTVHADFAPETVKFWDDLGTEFGFDWPSGDKIN